MHLQAVLMDEFLKISLNFHYCFNCFKGHLTAVPAVVKVETLQPLNKYKDKQQGL